MIRPTRHPHSRLFTAAGLCLAVLAVAGCGDDGSSGSSGNAIEDLKDKDAVTIGVANEEPYGYVEGDEPKGFMVDALEEILKRDDVTNIKPEVLPFDSLIPSAASGRLDLVGAGHAITPERCQAVIFTNPIYVGGDSFLQREGEDAGVHSLADVAADTSVKIGAPLGSNQVQSMADAGIPESQIVLFSTPQEGVAGLKADRFDVFFTPNIEGAVLAKKNDGIEVVSPFETGEGGTYFGAAALPKGEEDLRDAINDGLKTLIDDGTLLEIFGEYGMGENEMPDPSMTADQLCAE